MKRTYRMVGRIDSGESADFYLGVRDDGAEVLIKMFHARTLDPAYTRELAEVARVLNPLRSEGVVHLLEMGTLDQRLVIIREFIDGVSLEEALDRMVTREVSLAPSAALLIVLDMLSAVDRAHKAGVPHGAITPGDVLLGKDGRGFVCDFGVLRALKSSTKTRTVFGLGGRESYRSPEVGRGEDASVRSDIYSIAAIAYQLLTLHEARPSSQPEATVPRLAPSKFNAALSAQVDAVILKGLELQPLRRYPDCYEFSLSIRQLLITLGGLPGRDELRRFVRRLYVADSAGFKLNPPPILETFSLVPLDGASFPPPLEEESSSVTEGRKPFALGSAQAAEPELAPTEVIVFPPSPQPTKTLEWVPPVALPEPPEVEPFVTEPAVKETNAADAAPVPVSPPLVVPSPPSPPPLPAAPLTPVRGASHNAAPVTESAEDSGSGGTPFRPMAPLLVPRPPSPGSAAPTIELPRIVVEDALDAKRRRRRKVLQPVLGARHFPLTAWIWVGLLLVAVVALGGWLGLQRLKQQSEASVVVDPSAAEAEDMAYLSVFSDVPAELTVDGVRLPGQTPIQGFPLAGGKRKLVLQAIKGGHRRELEVVLKAGNSRRLDVSLGERAR